MLDYSLADTGPLQVVFRRENVICFDPVGVFDCCAEAEKGLGAIGDELFDEPVGEGKVVGGGVVRVGAKVAENVFNVHKAKAAVSSARVVEPRERNSGGFEKREHPVVRSQKGRVVYAVKGFYAACYFVEVDAGMKHFLSPTN